MPSLNDFIAQRSPAWNELAALVERAGTRQGIKRLTREELRRLGPLYQRAASDLAYARLRGAEPARLEQLNALVLRAHGLLYAERGPGGARLWRFLRAGLPELIRRRAPYILLAMGLFLLGCVVGAALQLRDPQTLAALGGSLDERRDFYKDLPTTVGGAEKVTMAHEITLNNIRVAINAFALGVLGAAPSAIPLIMTGLMVGSIAVGQHQAGNAIHFWSFIAPHAVPELLAIFLAAGAGMLIGRSWIAPGDLTRGAALKAAGNEAIRMVFGACVLLIFAGLTESYVSPTGLPPWAKFGYLGLMGVALAAYLRLGRHEAPPIGQTVS